jgi:hypothetical protein
MVGLKQGPAAYITTTFRQFYTEAFGLSACQNDDPELTALPGSPKTTAPTYLVPTGLYEDSDDEL